MPVKILRMRDRVRLKIGEVTFMLAPLSMAHKQEVLGAKRMVEGKEVLDSVAASRAYLRNSLKGVEGLVDLAGNDYQLEFDGDAVSDESLDEVWMLGEAPLLATSCWQLLNGFPDKITNEKGKALKGVKLDLVPYEPKGG